MPPARSGRPSPGRLLGLYALSVMEREGSVYGYSIAARIAQRTAGAWKPGPGAVYPALGSLVRRGLARGDADGRRRLYRITPQGRQLLLRLRNGMLRRQRMGPDIGVLWAEIAGRGEPGAFLIDRLESNLDRFVEYVRTQPSPPPLAERYRLRAIARLARAQARLEKLTPGRRTRRPAREAGDA